MSSAVTREAARSGTPTRQEGSHFWNARTLVRCLETRLRSGDARRHAAEEGLGINLEALDALAAQVRAHNNEVQARFEYSGAQNRLARAVG